MDGYKVSSSLMPDDVNHPPENSQKLERPVLACISGIAGLLLPLGIASCQEQWMDAAVNAAEPKLRWVVEGGKNYIESLARPDPLPLPIAWSMGPNR